METNKFDCYKLVIPIFWNTHFLLVYKLSLYKFVQLMNMRLKVKVEIIEREHVKVI